MTIKGLAPAPTERGLIVGTTGCGKTTLAKHLLACYRVVVAIDPKGTLGSGQRGKGHMPGYELARTPEQLARLARKHDRVQYRPDPKHQTMEEYDRVYEWVFRRGNTMVYTDEVFDIMRATQSPRFFRACITSGRELGVGMIHATQRPRGIDPRVVTESSRFYVFHLRNPEDVRLLGTGLVGPNRLEDYAFWYTHDAPPHNPPKKMRLTL